MKKRILSILCLTAILLSLLCTAASSAENEDTDDFPPRYDPRELGLVTEVKNQNPYGTCWAFAIASGMESNALVKGYGAYDLSEYQLAYMCTHAIPVGASSEEAEGPVCKGDWRKGPYGGILSSSLMKGCAIRSEEEYPYSNMELPLPEVEVSKGEEYFIRVSFDHPIAYALDGHQSLYYSYENRASGEPGETYIRTVRSEGTGDWYDTVQVPGKTGPCSACIKVLSKDRELP